MESDEIRLQINGLDETLIIVQDIIGQDIYSFKDLNNPSEDYLNGI